MEIRFIIGNILALLSVVFVFISVVKRHKTDLIKWQVINIVFSMFANIAFFAYAALITNCMAFVRNILAYKNKLTVKWTFLLSGLCVFFGWYFNNLGSIGWLAIIASSSYTILMYTTKNAQQMRYAMLFNATLWLIHDLYIQSYPTIMAGYCFILWTLIQILRYRNPSVFSKK